MSWSWQIFLFRIVVSSFGFLSTLVVLLDFCPVIPSQLLVTLVDVELCKLIPDCEKGDDKEFSLIWYMEFEVFGKIIDDDNDDDAGDSS